MLREKKFRFRQGFARPLTATRDMIELEDARRFAVNRIVINV